MSYASYRVFVEAIKANEVCRKERKEYNLIASTPVGKHIDPNLAKKQAIALLNCFEEMYVDSEA